jgi:hypothetical protein
MVCSFSLTQVWKGDYKPKSVSASIPFLQEPEPSHTGQTPLPPVFRHFGSSSFKWMLVPLPKQAAHLPSPPHAPQAVRPGMLSYTSKA